MNKLNLTAKPGQYLKIVTCFLLLVFFLDSCGNSGTKNASPSAEAKVADNLPYATEVAPPAIKKYGVRSGIVSFESTGLGITRKVVLYFDDFGAKEAEEKYDENNKIEQSSLCDGTNRYTIVYKNKTAFSGGTCTRGIAYKFDWEEVSKAGSEYKPKKLANVTIAGKDCESFSLEMSGNTMTYAGLKNVCLLLDQTSQFGNITYKAVSFEENAVIPADKLNIPADFQIKSGI